MFERFEERLRGSLSLGSGMHLEENRELIIENCRRIEEYNEVFMRLISGSMYINVWGSGLRAFDFKTRGLIIRGRFSRIEFEERSSASSERSAERLHKNNRKR